ncbi:MAG: hypothetical protein CVU06_02290 [Bacteroidetes bacterium HGW-Bacteroidetes-22]|nr:MAG: hypothetical protein CVU06_02290 [Bacteroidetes bacterium HGW-Bacteroidetes-22]
MNRIFFKCSLFLSLILILGTAEPLKAQATDSVAKTGGFFKNWRAEVHFGAVLFHGDVSEDGVPYMRDWRLGYGLALEKQLGKYFGIRAHLMNGKVAGRSEALGYKFESNLLNASLQTTFSFSRLWQDESYLNSYRTYATVGLGFINWKVNSVAINNSVSKPGDVPVTIPAGVAPSSKSELDGSMSVGLGLNYNVSDNVYLGIETSLHGTSTDKIDGTVKGSSAVKQDMYSYTSVGVGYMFDLKKSDKPVAQPTATGSAWNSLKTNNLNNELPEIIQGKVGQSNPSTVDVIAWVVPDEIEEGEEITLNIQIYKASIVGKGEIKVLLPENFYAPDQEIGPKIDFTSDDRNLTITLNELPEPFDFTLNVKIRSGKNPKGNYAIYILGRITDDQQQQYKLSSVVNFKQMAPVANR